MYGKTTMSTNGLPTESKCFSCDPTCHECVGSSSSQCISCPTGFYLQRDTTSSTWGSLATYGKCMAKSSSAPTLTTVYVMSDSDYSFPNTYFTGIQSITGTSTHPFYYLDDGIAKAYEIGAPYKSATITIYLLNGTGGSGNNIHYMRPIQNSEAKYIPANYDFTQTTKIIIAPATSGATSPSIIQFKQRDKFTFPVGAGLTISNV